MKVTNTSKAAFNYGGRTFAPGSEIEISDEHAELRGVSLAIESGRLSPVLGNKSKPASKPSEGKTVDELKAALDAKSIAYPSGSAKADLAKLLDDAA